LFIRKLSSYLRGAVKRIDGNNNHRSLLNMSMPAAPRMPKAFQIWTNTVFTFREKN